MYVCMYVFENDIERINKMTSICILKVSPKQCIILDFASMLNFEKNIYLPLLKTLI